MAKAKNSWSEKSMAIKEQFPALSSLDWKSVFREDPSIFGRIIADIQKLENASEGRPGKRPSVNAGDAAQYLRQYENDDFTHLPFAEAFMILKGNSTVRSLASACGLTDTMTQRLLTGNADPSIEAMVKVSRVFRKDPSYFVEYRIMYLLDALGSMMEKYPESSIKPFLRLKGNPHGDI